MSSPPNENEHLKAGHPPAVKAGGMRIKGARVHEEKLSKEEYESPWEGQVSKEKAPAVVISGAVVDVQKAYPPAASRIGHVKPQPTVVKPAPNKQINRQIHQPR